ncbi:MAG TPA: ATP-dependent DNA helicase RecG, partial [Bacilli bacterium]
MLLDKINIKEVKGITPRKVKDLEALGVVTVEDFFQYYPFRYEDYRIQDLSEISDGDKVTLLGRIYSEPHVHRMGRTKSKLTCIVLVDNMLVTALWFNRHFLKDKLKLGQEIILTGKWEQSRKQMIVSESEFSGMAGKQSGELQPVYSLSGPVTQKWLRKSMVQALGQFGHLIQENLPEELVGKNNLMPRKQAILAIHHPASQEEGSIARQRIVYEELFMFQLKIQAYKAISHDRTEGIAHLIDSSAIREFAASLPFQLTASQKQVISEVIRDMREPHCMNRLLQGDVGSGKTVVAAAALFAAVKAGYQGALMVPTEILAEQHLKSFQGLFAPHGIRVGLLTGSFTKSQRKEILAFLLSGELNILVGTHALIQEGVYFRNLGLVVTDEQHRFGVNQRSVLRHKGLFPDILTMTATPIPRTLAITAFGDMDVSTLGEMPKGRIPIKTYSVKHDLFERVLKFIQKEIEQGRQAYVICPLIEESEKLDVQNTIDLHAQLQQYFTNYNVGLLHGRLAVREKEETMRRFSGNLIQVLVSTTVVEVGVDVPNATIMVIYDAERFGLSQLHQLRGRVGRGQHPSYCVLIANAKSEISRERMKVMAQTNDGFEIARRDLELRGPGDFFGTKQSGLPNFRAADLIADY